jgi:hypothetical protein
VSGGGQLQILIRLRLRQKLPHHSLRRALSWFVRAVRAPHGARRACTRSIAIFESPPPRHCTCGLRHLVDGLACLLPAVCREQRQSEPGRICRAPIHALLRTGACAPNCDSRLCGRRPSRKQHDLPSSWPGCPARTGTPPHPSLSRLDQVLKFRHCLNPKP